MTRFEVYESATGDRLGTIEFEPGESDESLIETLEKGGYLDPGHYRLERDYFGPLDEDDYAFVVTNDDDHDAPVLTLEEDLDDMDEEDDTMDEENEDEYDEDDEED